MAAGPARATMAAVLERRPDPRPTPSVARVVLSPSGIMVGGAGAAAALLAGVPVVGAVVVGALAWGVRVLLALPRARRRHINPALVGEPWRGLARQALKAEARFKEAVAGTRPGPLRDRLEQVAGQVSVAVEEAWEIAKRGDSLDEAVRNLDRESVDRELATRQDELRQAPDRDDLAATVEALRRQQEAAQRVAGVARDALDRLRLLVAHLNEAVARAAELSLGPADAAALQPLGTDVDALVSDLESLRLALDDAGREAL